MSARIENRARCSLSFWPSTGAWCVCSAQCTRSYWLRGRRLWRTPQLVDPPAGILYAAPARRNACATMLLCVRCWGMSDFSECMFGMLGLKNSLTNFTVLFFSLLIYFIQFNKNVFSLRSCVELSNSLLYAVSKHQFYGNFHTWFLIKIKDK